MRKYKAVINVDRLELTYQSNESLKLVLSDTKVSEFAFGTCVCYANKAGCTHTSF